MNYEDFEALYIKNLRESFSRIDLSKLQGEEETSALSVNLERVFHEPHLCTNKATIDYLSYEAGPTSYMKNKDDIYQELNGLWHALYADSEESGEEQADIDSQLSGMSRMCGVLQYREFDPALARHNENYGKDDVPLRCHVVSRDRNWNLRENSFSYDKWQEKFKDKYVRLCGQDDEEFESIRRYAYKPVGPLLKGYPSRKLILADPGYGKTTLAKIIALAYACTDIADGADYDVPGELFPLFISCRDADRIEWEQNVDFLNIAIHMICQKFSLCEDMESIIPFLAEKAKTSKLLLIVDGLDQFHSVKNQEIFAKSLYEFLEEYPEVHLLLTSRISLFLFSPTNPNASVDWILRIPGLRYHLIPEMNVQEQERFIHHFCEALQSEGNLKEEPYSSDSALYKLHQSDGWVKERVFCNPMELTRLVLATGRNKSGTGIGYDTYIENALQWNSTSGMLTSDLKIYLAYLAYMSSRMGFSSCLPEYLVRKYIAGCSKDLQDELSRQVRENCTDQFMYDLEYHIGFIRKYITCSGEVLFEFRNSRLCEYLAGYALAHGYTDCWIEPFDIVSEHYMQENWQNVIAFMTRMSQFAEEQEEIIMFLVEKGTSGKNICKAVNILWKLLSTEIGELRISTDIQHKIYDCVFNFMRDNSKSEEKYPKILVRLPENIFEQLIRYAAEKFCKSRAQIDREVMVFGSFAIAEYLRAGEMPMQEAENIVVQSANRDVVDKALCALSALSRYRFLKIEKNGYNSFIGSNPLILQNRLDIQGAEKQYAAGDTYIPLSIEFWKALQKKICEPTSQIELISITLRDLAFGGQIIPGEFGTIDVYRAAMKMLSDEQFHGSAIRILQGFPINLRTLSFSKSEKRYPQKEQMLKSYRDLLKTEEKLSDAILQFPICALSGCWNDALDNLVEAFAEIEFRYMEEPSKVSDMADAEMKFLQRQFRNLTDPIYEAKKCCEEQRFEEARDIILIAYDSDRIRVCKILETMLKRGQIGNISIDGISMDKHSFIMNQLRRDVALKKRK